MIKLEWCQICSTCVAVADFLYPHGDVACSTCGSRLRKRSRPGSLIASLHYINTPKLALLQRWPVDQTCVNKKGAAHHWLPSFWIGRVSFHPFMRFPTWQTRQIHSPGTGLGGGWRQGWGLVWLILPTACSSMMISPNLHAIWPFLFLNLS